ncbi:LysR family transcriptional regulator [Labrys sp. ZIDIC5]|uniref:LysR family transcriptional regulator n=1 Tax=Labrys sedimenti TaxID=3106036 RepID=UPI002ACAFE22|nr:LysR family transcriptional regulator [Labrys sp. ZIDIC5]MDZ5449853.1 LysR family transcriptional regulator [Labrys sp. ZIDIC5]
MERDLDPHLLRALLAAAETGTISAAAERLSRTQAAVSMQLQRLEGDLGVRLLDRTPRGVSLTQAGETLAAYARRLLALTSDARRQIEGRQLAGRVRLGLVEDLTMTQLPLALAEFRQQHPKIQLDLMTAHSPELEGAVREGRCDIVIGDPARFGSAPHFHWSRRLVWGGSRLIDLSETAPVPFVAFEESCTWQDRTAVAFAEAGIAWTIACHVTTFAALVGALRAGLGISLMLPETLPADCEALAPRFRLPPPPSAHFGLFLGQEASTPTQQLAAFLRERLVA